MNFIQGILPDRIIDALGWTILHSLWQGLIIGILLFLLLFFYRHHNSVIRYNLSVFSLFMIFGLSILTFIFYFKDAIPIDGINEQGILTSDIERGKITSGIHSFFPDQAFLRSIQSITTTIPGKFPFIITLYMVGVLLISIRMTGGIYMTQRLRKSCIYEIPEELQKRFLHLISIMNIRKRVYLHGSSLITVPSVVGYFKPVILFPLCAVTQMPADQIEAIIAHELAHIRRHDYLVNLFQSLMEALFFYHPIMWMIQKRIRKERENCCDDMALSYLQGQITYIKALTSIQELPVVSGFPLLAINSGKQYLLTRILRILKKEKMKTNFKDKLLAGFILVSALVIILLSTGGKFISFNSMPDDSNPNVLSYSDIDQDTSVKVKDNIIQRTIIKDGKEIDLKMKVEKGEVTELYVDGKKIPGSGYGKYQPEIDRTLEDVKKLERELTESNQKLSQFEIQEITREMEESMRDIEAQIREIDIEAMVENIEVPEIDQEKIKQDIEKAIQEIETIDMEKIREEMEFAMQSAREEMQNIEVPDMHELRMEMEKAMQELKEIDQEKIQHEIQEAIKDIQIDKEAMQREIEKSLQEIKEIDLEEIRREIENERMNMEEDRIKTDQMLKEIEKLELEK